MRWSAAAASAVTMLVASLQTVSAQETLKFGLSLGLSGPAAYFGVNSTWAAQQAADKINADGGIKADGKVYKVEVKGYDNLYSAAGGATAAQAMISRDGIRIIANSQSTAAVIATQSLAERQNVLLFTGVWGNSVKGAGHPMTFTNLNSPREILPRLFEYVKGKHPEAKTVALLNPNDSSGQEVAAESIRVWERLGFTVVSNDFFERSTTDFSPIATRILAKKPDIIDVGATPLPNAGYVFKEMQTQSWNGVKIASAGSEAESLLKTGGSAAEGTYLGLAAVFGADSATPLQRQLNEKAMAELKQPLNQASIASYDAVLALRVAIEKAGSVDPKAIAAALPEISFVSSYGPCGFGYKAEYGLANQMLLPVIISQIKNGVVVEIERVIPDELKRRS